MRNNNAMSRSLKRVMLEFHSLRYQSVSNIYKRNEVNASMVWTMNSFSYHFPSNKNIIMTQ